MKPANTYITEFLEYVENQSENKIEDISKLINQAKRRKYPKNKECKYAEYSKDLKEDQFKLILDNEYNERLKLIYTIMYYMGLRISEVVLIKTIDINNDILTIHNIKCNRTEKLIIPIRIRKELYNFIEYNKEEIIKHNKYIFFSKNKVQVREHLHKDYVRRKFRELTLELNINTLYDTSTKGNRLYLLSSHSFRHSFAKRFYTKSGFDIDKTRQAMRHRRISDTQTYVKNDIKEVFKTLAEL